LYEITLRAGTPFWGDWKEPFMSNSSTGPERDARVTIEDVLQELRGVVSEAESLLRSTEDHVGGHIDGIRARVEETLDNAREQLAETGDGREARARAAAGAAEKYVRENPWTALVIAAGVGYFLGAGRRRG
jgi:ElaB/YqjD/DUF883 family membrane-anchored ribosome-binding protein